MVIHSQEEKEKGDGEEEGEGRWDVPPRPHSLLLFLFDYPSTSKLLSISFTKVCYVCALQHHTAPTVSVRLQVQPVLTRPVQPADGALAPSRCFLSLQSCVCVWLQFPTVLQLTLLTDLQTKFRDKELNVQRSYSVYSAKLCICNVMVINCLIYCLGLQKKIILSIYFFVLYKFTMSLLAFLVPPIKHLSDIFPPCCYHPFVSEML